MLLFKFSFCGQLVLKRRFTKNTQKIPLVFFIIPLDKTLHLNIFESFSPNDNLYQVLSEIEPVVIEKKSKMLTDGETKADNKMSN